MYIYIENVSSSFQDAIGLISENSFCIKVEVDLLLFWRVKLKIILYGTCNSLQPVLCK
jgi:hypothetical protein